MVYCREPVYNSLFSHEKISSRQWRIARKIKYNNADWDGDKSSIEKRATDPSGATRQINIYPFGD